jgi:hypothetical protein
VTLELNISDRIQAARRAFADGKPKAPKLNNELGGGGDYQAYFNNEENRTDTTSIETYRRMLDNDGTVEGLYKIITLPIKAASYHFTVDDGGEEELKLVEENFTLPPMQGGMSLPFDLFLADLLRSLIDGYRLFEKVFTINDQGKIVYRKLAPRDPLTLTLLRDQKGGFDGAKQKWLEGNRYREELIPVDRCFLFTYNKEFSFLYGRSAMKPMYYHYDKKHKLYHLDLSERSGKRHQASQVEDTRVTRRQHARQG